MCSPHKNRELLLRARAVDNQVYVAACSPARDPDSSYTAWGHSSGIFSPVPSLPLFRHVTWRHLLLELWSLKWNCARMHMHTHIYTHTHTTERERAHTHNTHIVLFHPNVFSPSSCFPMGRGCGHRWRKSGGCPV